MNLKIIISLIRRLYREEEYILSEHAEEEMQADGLERVDIENVIMNGWVDRKLDDDPRGTRYCVVGPALDERMIEMVCRFTDSEKLVIITVYDVDELYEK